MSQLMKIRCNGPKKCLNEIDLDDVITGTVITRGETCSQPRKLQERYVIRCKCCAEGRVIITKKMIEDFWGDLN